MAWVRIDDSAIEHEKLLEAGPEGVTLWLAGLSYCNRSKRRDGRIPDAKVASLYPLRWPAKTATRLVEVRLWERVEGGYAVHDYAEYQTNHTERLSKSEAGRLGGKRSGEVRSTAKQHIEATKQIEAGASSTDEASASSTDEADDEARARAPIPSRPDPVPSRPDLQKEIAGEGTVEPERIASVDPVVAALRAEPLLSEADLVGFAGELRSHGMNIGLCGAKGDARWLACLEFALVSLHARAMERPIDAPLAYLRKILKDTAPPRRLEQSIKDRVEAEKPRERAQIQARYPVAVVSEDFAANAVTEMATPDRTSTARPAGAMPTADERRRMVAEISSFVGPLAAAGGSR